MIERCLSRRREIDFLFFPSTDVSCFMRNVFSSGFGKPRHTCMHARTVRLPSLRIQWSYIASWLAKRKGGTQSFRVRYVWESGASTSA